MSQDTKIVSVSDSWMYLKNKKSLWYDLAENWILFWVFYVPLTGLIYFFYRNNWVIIRTFLLIFPIWAITVVRRYVRFLSLFALCNLLIVSTAYFIGTGPLERILFACTLAIVSFISMKKRYEEVVTYLNLNVLLFSELFLAVCYIIFYNLRIEMMVNVVTFSGIIIAICSMVYLHLTRTQKLMEWEEQFASRFSSRIKRLKIVFTALISSILAAMIWLVWATGIFKLLDDLQNRINQMFSFAPKDVPKKLPPSNQAAQNADGDMYKYLREMGGNSKDNLFIKVIMKLVEFAMIIIVIAVAAYMVWMLILKFKELYHRFYSVGRKNEEEREILLSTEEVTKEVKEGIRRVLDRFNSIFDRSNEKKIRNIYHRLIRKYEQKGIEISDCSTPGELEHNIFVKINKDIREATELYNKARYSNHPCSDDDVARIKRYSD